VPPPHFASRLELPAPVHDVEALGFGVQRLVQELAPWLTARGLGVVRLSLALAHERYVRQRGIPETVVPFALGAPARMPAHLLGVLRERLARVALPAAVEAITLASDETAPLAGRNLGLLPGDDAHAVEIPLLDRLRARLGEEAVMHLVPLPEHRPELAMRDAAIATAAGKAERPARNSHVKPAGASPLPEASRPIWLLGEPQPVAQLLEMQPWVLRDGPERIESGWWDGADVRRDYYVADTPAGETVWIYRDHRFGIDDGEWFLHGFFA
jgi:protein ImuB